ncbi:MAG TPA: S-layer protein [Methanoculleus sp.]|nr:S-layer protein [Methanoculleus sp.]
MNTKRYIILSIAIIMMICAPVMAAEKISAGPPDMRVSVAGSDEYYPGDSSAITITIENTATLDFQSQDPSVPAREDRPTTAKNVLVSVESGGAPVQIKTSGQLVGDIVAGRSASATFEIRIAKDAPAGTYTLPVTLTYTYLYYSEDLGDSAVRYYYKDKTETLPLEIVIRPDVRIEVVFLEVQNLNVGTEGYIIATVKNVGHETGSEGTLTLQRVPGSPIIPTDASSFIGEFSPGETVTVTFKASASVNAEESTYPIGILLSYENPEGDKLSTSPITMGVPTGAKIRFEIESPASRLRPGETGIVTVTYHNIGGATAYDAVSRLSAVDPFTSNDDTAYLGDIAPGESAVAKYEVIVKKDATIKTYGLDSEVRYKDALSNSLISDPVKVRIEIAEVSGLMSALTNPVVIILVLFAVLGAGYYLYTQRKKNE